MAILVALAAETLLLYGPSLHFSFLLDDSYDLVVARHMSYSALLTQPLPGFSYYRPLTFALYKLVHDLWGGTEPWHYHIVSVSLHLTNVILLALLVRRIVGTATAAFAASLFAAFPFAYQAVQIVCSLPHLLVSSALLGALLSWELGIGWTGRKGHVARCTATALALVAPGFHETGVLGGTLLLLWTVLRRKADRWPTLRSQSGWLAVVLLGNSIYLVLWFWVFDKPGMRPVTLLDRLENVAFWAQAATYPLTRQTTALLESSWVARHPREAAIGAALATGALALAFHALGGQLWLGLGALALASLIFMPAILFLPYRGYLEDGPRLLYPAAPAIATFWGLLPRAGWRWPRARWLGATLSLALMIVTSVQSIAFIERRTELGLLASHAQEAIIATARTNPGWPLVVVNAPAWLALHRYEYPLGHFGMNAQPEYLGFEALLEARLGWRQPVRSLAIALARDRGWYTMGPHGQASTHAELAALRMSGWIVRWPDPG